MRVEVARAGIFNMPTGSPPNGEPSFFITMTRRLRTPHRKTNDKARRMDKGWRAKGTGGGGGNKEIKCVRVFSIMSAIGYVISKEQPQRKRLFISVS